MGFLHRGHTSLIESARRQRARVAVSVFVNPLQFGPSEDFERYPRDLDRDVALAREAGAEIVFAPPVDEIYPDGPPWVTVVPERGSDRLCGASRPGHFRGVLTVVAKLFGIVTPDLAVFGRKDYQQLVLIRRMVEDLEMSVDVQGVATVREPDGLALSSRNRYLSEDERQRALRLVRALRGCVLLHAEGESDPRPYLELLHKAEGDGVSLDYAELVDPTTLDPVERVVPGVVCTIAAWVGGTRLIDNAMLGTDSLL
jgi:pantoate--beta-alanine ligase